MRESYIESHLDPPLPEEEKRESSLEAFSKLPESIRRPLNPEVRYGKEGTEKIELNDGWSLEYEYEAVNEEDGKYISYDGMYASKITKALQLSDYRKLRDLTLKNEKGESIDLKDIPVDRIFFSTREITDKPSLFQDRQIISQASPNSFYGIMALFHEGGHAILQERLLSDKSFKEVAKKVMHNAVYRMPTILHSLLPEKVVQASAEDVLRTERDAWAITLSKLRPSLEGFGVSNEDIEETIHRNKLALASHSERIREMSQDS